MCPTCRSSSRWFYYLPQCRHLLLWCLGNQVSIQHSWQLCCGVVTTRDCREIWWSLLLDKSFRWSVTPEDTTSLLCTNSGQNGSNECLNFVVFSGGKIFVDQICVDLDYWSDMLFQNYSYFMYTLQGKFLVPEILWSVIINNYMTVHWYHHTPVNALFGSLFASVWKLLNTCQQYQHDTISQHMQSYACVCKH